MVMKSAKVQPVEEEGPPSIQPTRPARDGSAKFGAREGWGLSPMQDNKPERGGGGGEEKAPEGAAPADVAPASPETAAATVSIPTIPSTTTTTSTDGTAGTPSPRAAAAVDEGTGGDTHVVGFEGARDQIIVVARKTTLWWLLFSADANVVIDRVFETFMLTPIFAVSGLLSLVGLIIALALGIEDTRWYWVFVACGVWLWLVSRLITR